MNLEFWTDFADSAVMMPLGVAVAVVLALCGTRRLALAWTTAVGGVWAVMLVLKFLGYFVSEFDPGSTLSAIRLVTPSGHVASATVIYAGIVGLVLRWPGTVLTRTTLTAIVVAVTIGATRVLLGDHSLSEVVVGGIVGIAGAVTLAATARAPLDRWRPLPVLAVTALVLEVRHGTYMSLEGPIWQTAVQAIITLRTGV